MELFCTQCGQKLVLTKSVYSYRQKQGTPVYLYTWKCPNLRWWNCHDELRLDEESKEFFDLDKDGLRTIRYVD